MQCALSIFYKIVLFSEESTKSTFNVFDVILLSKGVCLVCLFSNWIACE